MTWLDPIVEEVRRVRAAYAARFNNDLRAIFRDLKEQEARSGRKLVSYAKDAAATESAPIISEHIPSSQPNSAATH